MNVCKIGEIFCIVDTMKAEDSRSYATCAIKWKSLCAGVALVVLAASVYLFAYLQASEKIKIFRFLRRKLIPLDEYA